MKTKELKSLERKLVAALKKEADSIAAARDRLRTITDEYYEILQSVEGAEENLRDIIEKISERL